MKLLSAIAFLFIIKSVYSQDSLCLCFENKTSKKQKLQITFEHYNYYFDKIKQPYNVKVEAVNSSDLKKTILKFKKTKRLKTGGVHGLMLIYFDEYLKGEKTGEYILTQDGNYFYLEYKSLLNTEKQIKFSEWDNYKYFNEPCFKISK